MTAPLDIPPSPAVAEQGLDLACFASPLARREAVAATAEQLLADVTGVLGDLAPLARPGRTPSLAVALVLTGGTEAQVLDWLGRREDGGGGGPLLLVAVPHSNSLPAALEILARLGQDGRRGRVVMAGHAGWEAAFRSVLRAAQTTAWLRGSRIGLVGGPSDWLVASSPAPEVVRERWGPEVVAIPLAEVLNAVATVDLDREELDRLCGGAAGVGEPDTETLAGAVVLGQALDRLVERHRLDAVTVRCFDLLGPLNNTGCVALSRLNDRGITAACEGDLPALLTMMVLQRLSGRPTFMANPSAVSGDGGRITFGHCSVPLGIVAGYRLRSHFESQLGVGLEGRFAPGMMTIARIGGRDLTEFEAFTGWLGPQPHQQREDLCRTQVTLDVSPTAVESLLERPLGNHHIIAPGDHVAGFRLVAGLVAGGGTAHAAGR